MKSSSEKAFLSRLEEPRSPRKLQELVEEIRVRVGTDQSKLHAGLKKEGRYKQFLEEIVPLSRFASLAYSESERVQWVPGNQGYDALVLDSRDCEVDRIEVTTPIDGRAEAEDARLVASRGYGKATVGKPTEDFAALLPRIVETCQNKSTKDYGNCTLVIAVAPLPPFVGFERQYEVQLEKTVEAIAKIEFRAKRVFLLVLPDCLVQIRAQRERN